MPTQNLAAAGLQRLHSAMAAAVDRGDLPGVVTCVSRGNDTVIDATGTLSFGDPAPMTADTIFRIASLSKPVSAAAAMILVEEGKLALQDPVDRLLPELANRQVLKRLDGPIDDTVPATRRITLDDLLTLRMGTGAIMAPGTYPIVQAMIEQGVAVGPNIPDTMTPDAWIAGLGRLPLMRQPGEAWLYDTGLTVLGVLLERAAGQPLETFMRERLFQPLGMADTEFSVPAAKLDRLPVAYMRDTTTGTLGIFDAGGTSSRFARPPAFASASGGLVSTAQDYRNFAAMMLNRGVYQGKRLLSEQSVTLMTTDHITAAQKATSPFVPGFWDKCGWGFGLSTVHRSHPEEPRGFGWLGGYGTAAHWDPETGLIAILLTQRLMELPTPPTVFTDFWRAANTTIGA